jgi:hypothetical protein
VTQEVGKTKKADMNEQLRQKLYDLELRPPELVWDKITEAMDEDADLASLSQLYDLELKPPAKVWNSISTKLDSDVVLTYPSKLYNLEIEPPADNWKNISTALDEEKQLPRISPFRRYPVFRYAAAAILVGLIAFGVKWLTAERISSKVSINDGQNQNQQKSESVHPTSPEFPKSSNNLPAERPREEVSASTSSVKSTSQPSSKRVARLFKLPSREYFHAGDFQNASLNGNIPGSQAGFADVSNRYLVFENTDGNMIRISKKLAESLGCNINDKNSTEYQRCIEQIKKWRDKIANSLIIPAPDNFMDIFQLIKSTDENQF